MYQTGGIAYDKGIKAARKEIKAGRTKQNLVIFALLGILHALHEVKKATEVSSDFKHVVEHISGDDPFAKLLVSEENRHRLAGDTVFFLSKMERDYILSKTFSASTQAGEGRKTGDDNSWCKGGRTKYLCVIY